MMTSRVLIRADASSKIGTGHVMRCLGLAQQLRLSGYEVAFALAVANQGVLSRLRSESFDCEMIEAVPASGDDLAVTREICVRRNISLLIVDGYQFHGNWLRDVRIGGCRIMLWTDYLQDVSLPVDIILDQTPAANAANYRTICPHGIILAGLNYAVLRDEFLHATEFRHRRTQVEKILVTMGGSDPNNDTLKVLESIRQLKGDFSLNVVVGAANNYADEIVQAAELLDSCVVYQSVNDMSELIARSDLAISAGGTTLWEFAYSGLPTLIIAVADNQLSLAKSVADSGGGIFLGASKSVDTELIATRMQSLLEDNSAISSMSESMLQLVDGDGRKRVANVLMSILAF